ncbi:hypothetical protein H6G00_33000 [Leptolyngbya sp. FACHB-541]|uniref:hypothetical protein n=1 Tax=Leptolyngbya sp. FACHB-541 TaxID=2692810 RepID=UPI001682A521|nr:hypothetical protein [Leptolyngbya sp. FACHB-541]MBD2001359.1 hypothetical protein [Leptolyngbya sp. FACHB-541]
MNNFHLYVVRLMALALLAIAAVLGVSPDASAASPESVEISFDLAPVAASSPASAPLAQPPKPTPTSQAAPQVKPLQIPTQATHVPVGVADTSKAIAELPPPPPEVYVTERSPQPTQPEVQPEPVEPKVQPTEIQPESVEPEPIQFETAPTPAAATPTPKPAQPSVAQAPVRQPKPSTQAAAEPTALSFELNSTASSPTPSPTQVQASPSGQGGQATPTPNPQPPTSSLDALFQNGSNSIVAKAVGSAEGTRTPDGGRTWAFQGHVDPGNGVWNLGTFSYQHGANSPDEADRKQLERLRGQAQTLRRAALERGITLTLEEELNGIDLANQSPRAALSRGGYIDRLKEAHDVGLRGSDAVLWARTRSFLDPDTNRWNAPGLGNTTHGVTSDQARRMQAIAKAIEMHQQVAATPSAAREEVLQPIATASSNPQLEQVASYPSTTKQDAERMEEIANDIISLDLAPM